MLEIIIVWKSFLKDIWIIVIFVYEWKGKFLWLFMDIGFFFLIDIEIIVSLLYFIVVLIYFVSLGKWNKMVGEWFVMV